MKLSKQILSVLTIAAFFMIAIASKVNKIHGNAFSGNSKPEDDGGSNYVLLDDGTRVNGKKISWKTGAFTKDELTIDNQKFKLSEVQGYMQNGTYWKRGGHGFMVRLVHGKLNVYRDSYETTSTTTNPNGVMQTKTITHYVHYVQREGEGMTPITDQKSIQAAVSDCPLAVEMASLSDKQMRKAIKANRRYLNEIFEVYNNDCKPLQK